MIVKRPSKGKSRGRNVTPIKACSSVSTNFQTRGFRRGRRGRQLSRFKENGRNKDRAEAGGRVVSGCRRGGGEDEGLSVGPHQDSSSSTSVTMPSGVSCFLLDCLDVDSSDEDETLSPIEEFRKADTHDEVTMCLGEGGAMKHVKNSTLLDWSHAQDLDLQQPPNLSSILEISLDPGEKKEESFISSPIRLSPVRPPLDASGCVLTSADEKTSVNMKDVLLPPIVKTCFAEREKPIKCRKVTFSDTVIIRNVSSYKCGEAKQRKGRGSREIRSAPGRFFDFANDCERRDFFHRLKKTCSFKFPAKPIT